MIGAVVEVMLPVVLVAAVGATLSRFFPLDLDTIGKVGLYGFFPFLAYQSIVTTTVSAQTGLVLGLAYLAVTGAGAAIAWAGARGYPRAERRGIVAGVALGNNGNFGLPIALLALGREGLDQSLVIFVWSMVVMFTVGPGLLGDHADLRGAARTVLKLPVLWGIAVGFVVRATGVGVPLGLSRGIELLAQGAIPIVLLALGAQIAATSGARPTRTVGLVAATRLLLSPVLAAGIGVAFGLHGTALAALVLASAMPTAVNAFMIAREYGSGADTQASVVALSTLASVVTIPVTITLLPLLP
ncbi:MAG: AEC family transporter [Austwickia sp.]|nr:MAG: AEC family transporter [Austwickia sp.]